MPDAPATIHEELFCRECSRVQPVTRSGKTYVCAHCQGQVEPVTDPDHCPRSPSGKHNPFRDSNFPSGWCCSQCLQPMSAPADADVYRLGRRTV
jgi:hypothetical protein